MTTTLEQFREQCAKTIELFDDATMRESDYMLSADECADIIRALPLPVMPSQDVNRVIIPSALIHAACHAIDKKADAPNVLAQLRSYATGTEVMPEQAEPVAKRELIDLYKAVNEMMLAIGMFGSIESDNECVTNVMNALYALDDGSAIIRANDLVEKAFMPFNQAFPKAIQEYIDKLEGRLDRYEMLARIAELEAENQKLKEGK